MTLRDVARVASVHPATVSRALNEETRALVNEETARRVLKAAEELGYRPNPIARGLKTNRSYTIGVLIPDLTNPLFPPILRGIEDRLETAGYTPLIANTDNDPERELLDSQTMRARQVDGIIAATARRDHRLHDALLEAGIELVLVNRRQEELPVSSATADDRMGMRLSVEHLVSLGHTRIAHLAGPLDYSTGLDRHEGFHETMRAAGLEPDPELVLVAEAFTESEGARLCEQLMAARPRLHRGRRGERPARAWLLRRVRRARRALSGGGLGRGLQRHAVRGALPAAAHDDPHSALRDRQGGRRS